MRTSVPKLLLGILVLVVAAILILPIGIRTNVEFVSFGETPKDIREENKQFGLTTDTYETEAECTYFVRIRFERMTYWHYSDTPEPELPGCEFLNFAWHGGWLMDPGTVWF